MDIHVASAKTFVMARVGAITGFFFIWRRCGLFLRKDKPRDLRRALNDQFTEDYWARRQYPVSRIGRWCLLILGRDRVSRLLAIAYGLSVRPAKVRDARFGILIGIVPSLLRSFGLGAVLVGIVIAAERGLTYLSPSVVPASDPILLLGIFPIQTSGPPLAGFPTLAVQVSASLLGFYLASVGIVLGTSYHNVSFGVRTLVLGNPARRLYLGLIGMAIGAGLILILLESVGVSYGYIAIGAFVLLVAMAGVSFIRLASGVFDLFSPVVLGEEPLQLLRRAIDELEPKRLHGQGDVIQRRAQEADTALRILGELISVTRRRPSDDRDSLAILVERLLLRIQLYATRKHLLDPNSPWFLRQPIYPRWIESSHYSTSMALRTSTSLQPELEPDTYWLERRAASLTAEALDTCVMANNRNAALRITREASSTVEWLAVNYHVDEGIIVSEVVRDKCWDIKTNNAAATAVMGEPPLFVISLLLGWRQAIGHWAGEVCSVVESTRWERRSMELVTIRGTLRVRSAAQRMLRNIHGEREVTGRRLTPDWYLKATLAGECIISFREVADSLSRLMDEYFVRANPGDSPAVQASISLGAMQALAKAELMGEAFRAATDKLQELLLEHDSDVDAEIDQFSERIQSYQNPILGNLSQAISKMQPQQSKVEPDLFGQGFNMLVHHAVFAIATGDSSLLKRVFPNLLTAALTYDRHVRTTYTPPRYQFTATLLDPLMDLLEVSGLALIYEVLQKDNCASVVRDTWSNIMGSSPSKESDSTHLLNLLDISTEPFTFGTPVGSIKRSEWEAHLAQRIVESGYAIPNYIPFDEKPRWDAPPLIKTLQVSTSMPALSLSPTAVFGAEILGPLSGEPIESLIERPSLKHYYEAIERYNPTEREVNDHITDDEGIGYEL